MKRLTHGFYAWLQRLLPNLQPRELMMICAMTVFIFGVIAWSGVWAPTRAALEQNQASYQSSRDDLDWMKANAEKIRHDTPVAVSVPADAGALLAAVTESAQAAHLTINHAEPAEDGALNLSLETVPFTQLLPWLETLQTTHGVRPVHISIDRQISQPGYVSSRILLKAYGKQ